MNTIYRNGIAIELTDEEVRSIREDEHRKDIEYEFTEAVSRCLDEGWISFSDWSKSGSEYSSEDDARTDFIAKLTEDYLEQEELYEYSPLRLHNHDFDSDVMDLAPDFGYRNE